MNAKRRGNTDIGAKPGQLLAFSFVNPESKLTILLYISIYNYMNVYIIYIYH